MTEYHPILIFLEIISSIALVLFGQHLLISTLREGVPNLMERLAQRYLSIPPASFIIAAIVATFFLNSCIITIIAMGFIEAGLLSSSQGIVIMLGATLGSIIDPWVSANVKAYIPPIFIITGFGYLLALRGSAKAHHGNLLLAVALMNQGVMILNALSPLIVKNILSLINLATLSTSESFIGILSITLLGTFSNALIQSTNINLELVNTYMDQQKIAAEEGIAFMLGSNLGLTIIPLLAAVTLHKKSARKVAYAYLVSISHTTLIVLLFYKSFISLIATIAVYISRLPTASLIVKTGYMSFVLFNAVLWFLLRDLLVLVVKGFKRHQHDKQLHLRDIVLALPEYAREFFFEFAEQLEMAIRQVRYNLDYLVNAVEIGSTVNYTEFSKHLDDLAISLTQAENSLNALIIYARQTRTYPRALTYYIQIFSTLNSIKGISEAIEKQVPHIGQVSNPVTLQELQKIKKDYQNALSSLFDYLHVNYNPEEYTEEHRVNATNHLTIVRLETYLHQIKIIIDDLVKS